MKMMKGSFIRAALAGTSLLFAVPALAQGDATQPAPEHHSKLKGAAVGGVSGAMIGGKKGAAAGAAGGALVQHHRNKKAEKAARRQ